ncbi:hypothetical protein ACGYLO_16505 [Sulfitobacter sp. 1A13353]|uniref:hypothetical protein n=1 Tax=Sulfitobacter sp. 1A13353 TaxID=3368568 RepID=UPI003746080D
MANGLSANPANAAEAILSAGCGGVLLLSWCIRFAQDGEEPHYPSGDAFFDEAMYPAIRDGLELYQAIAERPPCEDYEKELAHVAKTLKAIKERNA